MRNNMNNDKEIATAFDEWYAKQTSEIKAAVDHHMAIIKTQVKHAGEISGKVILAHLYLKVQEDK